jgi:outer membrane lipoprotein-sorting protein
MNKNRQLFLSEGSESVIYDAKMNTKIELKDTSNTKTPVKEQPSPSPGSSRKRKRKFSKRLSFSSEVDD